MTLSATFAPTGAASNPRQSLDTQLRTTRAWISSAWSVAGLDAPSWSTAGRELLAATDTRAPDDIAASAVARAHAGEDVGEVAAAFHAEMGAASADREELARAVALASLREARTFVTEHVGDLRPAWTAAVSALAEAAAALPVDHPLDRDSCNTRASAEAWFAAADALATMSALSPVAFPLCDVRERSTIILATDGSPDAEAALAEALDDAELHNRKVAANLDGEPATDGLSELIARVARGDLPGVSIVWPGLVSEHPAA